MSMLNALDFLKERGSSEFNKTEHAVQPQDDEIGIKD